MASRKKTANITSNPNLALHQLDSDFHDSECEYQSDVFREQPSQITDINASLMQPNLHGQQRDLIIGFVSSPDCLSEGAALDLRQ